MRGFVGREVSAALRAQLACRIRRARPVEWDEFSNLWMAFNAIYGGEPDHVERDRVMGAITRFVNSDAATRIMRANQRSIEEIIAVPPGDMRRDRNDPEFREASARCAERYRSARSHVEQLAAAAGVLYQVRCNLTHGAKDPESPRDVMLVSESLKVLRELVPVIEAGALAAPG